MIVSFAGVVISANDVQDIEREMRRSCLLSIQFHIVLSLFLFF